MNTIDIVIPLGNGSRYNNEELRYCLRGVEKHLTNVGRVIIVGIKPDWITNIVYVLATDNPSGKHRALNISNKLRAASIMAGPNWLYINDDHFLLTDYDVKEFPSYHRGIIKLQNHRLNLPQFRQYKNTISRHGIEYDFGVHCPIQINTRAMHQVFQSLPTQWPDYGYEIKSLYANSWDDTTNWVPCTDLKFQQPLPYGIIKDQISGRPWFSVGDRCLNGGGMFKVLEELYPNKSKYEI